MSASFPWHSKLTLEQVFSQDKNFSYPTLFGNGCIYLTNLQDQDNRAALIYQDSRNNESICLTPEPYDLRTNISEYGGKPYWLIGNKLIFSNQRDQRLYLQDIVCEIDCELVVGLPNAISPKPKENHEFMYSDVTVLHNRWVLTIVETANLNADTHVENTHAIQAFSLDSVDQSLIPLVEGANFYSNLVFSVDATKVAWVQWNHPSMPWDETQLWVADIRFDSGKPVFINQHRIQLESGACVCQLIFANNGALFYSVDFQNKNIDSPQNYWNVMCLKRDASLPVPVSSLLSEFGYPHWQYGDTRIVQVDSDHLLSYATTPDGDQCYLINQTSLEIKALSSEYLEHKSLQQLSSNGAGKFSAVMLSTDASPVLIEFDILKGRRAEGLKRLLSNTQLLGKSELSIAEHIEYVTSDDSIAYGYYYPPVNSAYKNKQTENSERPPLIVMVHGGPTARAYGFFDLQKQFWTNRGFAIFDVNHRGSSGYGRAYRDALYGQWGIIDTSDIIDGINFLVAADKEDPAKICIRGKSAGGYAVLRALTEYPDVFRAGACYYGIGNLSTLAQVTHKFEKVYTDRLIGEKYASETANTKESLFHQRSPIHKASELKTPMIIFQGLKDKIVPPAVAEEMVSVLKRAGLPHSYVEYPDEGHGFRRSENNIDAWSQELEFYQTVFE